MTVILTTCVHSVGGVAGGLPCGVCEQNKMLQTRYLRETQADGSSRVRDLYSPESGVTGPDQTDLEISMLKEQLEALGLTLFEVEVEKVELKAELKIADRQRSAIETQLTQIRSDMDSIDCTYREGGGTRHCTVALPSKGCLRCQLDSAKADLAAMKADRDLWQAHAESDGACPSESLRMDLAKAEGLLRKYEKWEASVVLTNQCWRGPTPTLTQDQTDTLTAIAAERWSFLNRDAPTPKPATCKCGKAKWPFKDTCDFCSEPEKCGNTTTAFTAEGYTRLVCTHPAGHSGQCGVVGQRWTWDHSLFEETSPDCTKAEVKP